MTLLNTDFFDTKVIWVSRPLVKAIWQKPPKEGSQGKGCMVMSWEDCSWSRCQQRQMGKCTLAVGQMASSTYQSRDLGGTSNFHMLWFPLLWNERTLYDNTPHCYLPVQRTVPPSLWAWLLWMCFVNWNVTFTLSPVMRTTCPLGGCSVSLDCRTKRTQEAELRLAYSYWYCVLILWDLGA